jgi:hypothetical protein
VLCIGVGAKWATGAGASRSLLWRHPPRATSHKLIITNTKYVIRAFGMHVHS